MPIYAKQLKADPANLGWGVWLIVPGIDSRMIGDIGFTGKPNQKGVVEIGYRIVLEY